MQILVSVNKLKKETVHQTPEQTKACLPLPAMAYETSELEIASKINTVKAFCCGKLA
jgi:hypothetical protein